MVVTTTPVRTNALRADVDLNFSVNRNEVVAISDERPSLTVGGDFLRAYVIEEGEPFGNVYSRGFLRDEQGRVIVASNGMPRITAGRNVKVANYNPDWLGSLLASVSWKDWSASVLIDHRQGGTITSITNAIMYADGATEQTLQGREGGLVFGDNFFSHEVAVLENGSPNTIPIHAETFWRGVGGRNAPAGEVFVVDATNTRVREVAIGYTVPRSLFRSMPISGMKISFVARNLFFIHRASENIDPDVLIGTGKSAETRLRLLRSAHVPVGGRASFHRLLEPPELPFHLHATKMSSHDETRYAYMHHSHRTCGYASVDVGVHG